MNIAIISSSKDKASINIKENLINYHNFSKLEQGFDGNIVYYKEINDNEIKLYTINSELIHADDLDKKIDADLFVFISRHSAKEERKCLTAHVPGNFGKSEMGGKERTLCIAPAFYLKNIIKELNKNAEGSDYEISMEATHHGPFLEKPVLFVEIGSSEKEWVDENAGNIIAQSIINTMGKNNNNFNITINNNSINNNSNNKNFNENKINNEKNNINNELKINKKDNENNLIEINKNNNNYESVFVIGGGHYNHVANKVMLETNLAVGHICAKYNLENLNYELIKEAMKKTVPKARFVLLDWKGLGNKKQNILKLLDNSNIVYRRSDKFF